MTGTSHRPQFKTCIVPSGALVPTACREIAQSFTGGTLDAASLTILVPDLHAVPAVARALRAAFAVPVLVSPRIVTLRAWAETVPIDEEFIAPAQREAHLYRALAERNWLAGADLWAVAAELAGVFDELSRWHVRLPASVDDFKVQLDAAYRARAGASFGFEARLIHELWHASHAPGILDAETAYGLRLMRLAKQVAAPIHALGLTRLAPVEEDFLRRCAARVAVARYEVDRDAPACALEHFLAQAWPQNSLGDIYERARQLRQAVASPPLTGRLKFFGATSAEEEAQAVDTAVRRWLRQGRTQIGVVIFDRVVARRARALLERAEVLVRDETGWPLSTTSAATAIGRWLDAVSNDFYHRDCLDLLKSPFVLHDQPRDERQQAVWRLERALRAANVHSGIARFLGLAEQAGDRVLSELLKRLARAEQLFARNRRKTLRAWIDALQRSLTEIGVYAGLAADAAGIEVLELLDSLRADLDTDALRLEFGEWRRWLTRKLEGAAFRDRSIDSPIVFTTLAATRLRTFDAAIILGADVSHLPGSELAGSLFNQSVRRELGLPVRTDDIHRTEEELSALLASCDDVLVTWQQTRDGEGNLLSPLLERLTVLHGMAWGEHLWEDTLRAAIASTAPNTHCSELPPATARSTPRITGALLPVSVSASAYNSLLACPYQFHARYVLGLAKIDEVQEEVDKADYGTRVHDVLSEFHRACPRVSELEPNAARQRLEAISRQAFQELIAHDYQASAWLARWLALVPQYLDWQRAREAAGWRFIAAEADRKLTITTPGGLSFVLRGRIDRVDAHADGTITVVDYKTRAAGPLRQSLSAFGEDVQLPAYALLWGGEVAAAFFLSLDRDGVAQVDLAADVDALACATRIRLARIYDEIAAGAPLPAQGAEEVCRYCDVRGLCRKNFWQ